MLIRLLRRHLRPYALQVGLITVLLAMQAIAALYLPNLTADIINNGVVKGDVGYIWRTGGLMLAISLGAGVVQILAVYWSSRTSMSVGRDIRGAVFQKVQSFSTREMNHFGTASLITRNTNDVQQIQIFLLMALMILMLAPIMGIGGVIMALKEDVGLSTILVVVVPVMAILVAVMLKFTVPLFRSMQTRIDRVQRVLREQITGVRVVRAFVRTEEESVRFDGANRDLTQTALRVNRIFVIAMPAIMSLMNLSSVAVIWFGGHFVGTTPGTMPIGNMTAFLSYLMQILFAVMMGVIVFILVPRAMASATRLQEVLDTVPSIRDPAHPVIPISRTGAVEFRNVSFGYPGSERPVLQSLSFTMRPGETVAVIGGTGAGKTTLLNLIPRFFDASAGAVLVDGVDIREWEREQLWSSIGLIPQRAYLFSGTVADNLRFSNPEATDEELWHALEVAQARDFVAAMPDQLGAPIDQGGSNVSGGQRQRIAIARAIVRRPRIYLFDDCFSALDAATDARLRLALRSETEDASVMIVAQRVSTIMHADSILVLDEGRIVGSGRHQQLIAGCPEYREIVVSQLGEEAAA
ncbi:MAG TPA: ABC transporter ATP-binding protein [Candidatus Binatia bacterium]|nr:ABC transporter ATP-binding protein [Candidatus Binatia bacterium]